MLFEKIKSVSQNRLSALASAGLLLWLFMPIAVMPFNLFKADVHLTYNIWATAFYLVGGLGVALGSIYLYKRVPDMENKKAGTAPLILMLAFMLWAVISALFSKHPYAAFFGFTTMKDCITSLFSYAGFIFLGLVLSADARRLKKVLTFFLLVSAFLAFTALTDNELASALSVNAYTNTFRYQSVFYNTNHYAYYLLIDIISAGLMFVFAKREESKKRIFDFLYLAAFILFLTVLILNDTFGAYLAVLITLIFLLVFSFSGNKACEEKTRALILFVIFLLVSVAMQFVTGNVFENFSMLFSDAGVLGENMIENSALPEVSGIGSGRGALWRLYWDVMKKYPLFGVGPENIGASAHNVFLQIGGYTGFAGLALYLAALLLTAFRLFRKRHELKTAQKISAYVVTAYLISAFFGVTMFYTAPYFYVALGVCLFAASGDLTDDAVRD